MKLISHAFFYRSTAIQTQKGMLLYYCIGINIKTIIFNTNAHEKFIK